MPAIRRVLCNMNLGQPHSESTLLATTANHPVGYAPLSCIVCHRRKVKCDRRTDGCSKCATAGAVCSYPTPKPSRQGKRAQSSKREQELERKLIELELKLQEAIHSKGLIQAFAQNKGNTELANASKYIAANVTDLSNDLPMAQSDTPQKPLAPPTIIDRFLENFVDEVCFQHIKVSTCEISLRG